MLAQAHARWMVSRGREQASHSTDAATPNSSGAQQAASASHMSIDVFDDEPQASQSRNLAQAMNGDLPSTGSVDVATPNSALPSTEGAPTTFAPHTMTNINNLPTASPVDGHITTPRSTIVMSGHETPAANTGAASASPFRLSQPMVPSPLETGQLPQHAGIGWNTEQGSVIYRPPTPLPPPANSTNYRPTNQMRGRNSPREDGSWIAQARQFPIPTYNAAGLDDQLNISPGLPTQMANATA